jgi:hypothetical protein
MFVEGQLKENEICPGVSWDEHAESVAMFKLRDTNYSEGDLTLEIVDVLARIDQA